MSKNRKARSIEQIIRILRDAEIKLSSGMTVSVMCRDLGISDATYYKWRKQYGGMDVNHAKDLKALLDENARLKKLVADLSLDNQILKEFNSGKW